MQKLRENHETIQKLTSQMQEIQDQMNSMNDPGEFQEVESNNSGRLSYVSSQPAMSPHACLLTHGIHLAYRKTFLVDLPRDHPQGIVTLTHHKENEDQFHKLQGHIFSQEMAKQNRGTI